MNNSTIKYLFILTFLLLNFKVNAKHACCLPYKKGNLWGICDTNAKVIVQPLYSTVNCFNIGKETLIAFIKNKKAVVYINAILQPILSHKFDSIQRASFSAEGTFFIFNKGKMGLVENGKIIFQPMYDSLDFTTNNRIIAKKNNLVGLISTTNKIIIPFQYEQIKLDWYKNQHREKSDSLYYWEAKGLTTDDSFVDPIQPPVDYFYDDEIMLVKEGGSFDIDKKNKQKELALMKEFTYAKIVSAYSRLFYVKDINGQMGVYDYYAKKIVVPMEFDNLMMNEEIEQANYCVVYRNGKAGFYNGLHELLSVTYDAINIDEIGRGIIFPIKNALYGMNFLSEDMDLNILPKYSSLKYHARFKVNEDWYFVLFEAIDTKGNKFYVGENGLEYFSK
ncbi:MAG: WG repeat-containing protein [Chitinophagaceae bacterium]|nr:WG repeat-containing protein [Chitinophagaceae bacterium]